MMAAKVRKAKIVSQTLTSEILMQLLANVRKVTRTKQMINMMYLIVQKSLKIKFQLDTSNAVYSILKYNMLVGMQIESMSSLDADLQFNDL